jgi:BTB/POZ domain-containing protein 9
VSVDQAIHVCNGITDLWESKRHTDITFLVQGTRVAAHRIILASQSQYFDRLLFGEMREAHEDEIQLSDVENVESFQMLMQYAYSGSVDIQNGDIQVNTIIVPI